MSSSYVNEVTANLKPYPMEELARIKQQLVSENKKIYDFGTGDPKIPTWQPIIDQLKETIPSISQYPTIKGMAVLANAQKSYLEKRLGLKASEKWDILPTRGSKEAIFHMALCLVGRNNRKRILYPNPGYPVYKSSIEFAGGIATPYDLNAENNYLLEPWTLDQNIISDMAALWVNYPHNPTGAVVDEAYWQKLINWCHSNDVILLADDCYIDIYMNEKPHSPLQFSQDRVLTVMSLSKRSGLTGFRSGFIAGDINIITPLAKARANFGLGQPEFIQHASAVAWNDESHVDERREIFKDRVNIAGSALLELGLIDKIPEGTFYIWCRVPDIFNGDDINFCLELAKKGIICSPSTWLAEGRINGYFRLALVPDIQETKEALNILKEFIG